MKVYVIAGKAGSGKNTTANYIKEYYEKLGKKVAITEISKYLKLFAYEIKDWDGTRENKPREFLQNVGSFVRHEAFNEDFFINRLIEDTVVYKNYVDVLIIADARFPRELDMLKEKCGAIKIEVINEFNDYELKNSEKFHETETSLDNYNGFDYILHNKTLEELQKDVNHLVEEVENNEK